MHFGRQLAHLGVEDHRGRCIFTKSRLLIATDAAADAAAVPCNPWLSSLMDIAVAWR
jgi:hypothetical protein